MLSPFLSWYSSASLFGAVVHFSTVCCIISGVNSWSHGWQRLAYVVPVPVVVLQCFSVGIRLKLLEFLRDSLNADGSEVLSNCNQFRVLSTWVFPYKDINAMQLDLAHLGRRKQEVACSIYGFHPAEALCEWLEYMLNVRGLRWQNVQFLAFISTWHNHVHMHAVAIVSLEQVAWLHLFLKWCTSHFGRSYSTVAFAACRKNVSAPVRTYLEPLNEAN